MKRVWPQPARVSKRTSEIPDIQVRASRIVSGGISEHGNFVDGVNAAADEIRDTPVNEKIDIARRKVDQTLCKLLLPHS